MGGEQAGMGEGLYLMIYISMVEGQEVMCKGLCVMIDKWENEGVLW